MKIPTLPGKSKRPPQTLPGGSKLQGDVSTDAPSPGLIKKTISIPRSLDKQHKKRKKQKSRKPTK